MNGLPVPMGAENPYAAEVIAARQRIARLKDRLALRAAARRNLLSDKEATLGPLTEASPVILQPLDCSLLPEAHEWHPPPQNTD